jgi:predicted hotdog family 3-hydroxylacyl-ACP dehydratase
MSDSKKQLPLPVETLIPHRKPMCLVDHLVEFKDQAGTVEARVLSGQILVDDDGRLETLAVAEMIAQAYAAVKGYDDRLAGRPVRQGFWVGIRKIQFHQAVFAGDHLRIHVNTVGSIAGFAVVEGVVTRESDIIAEGQIKLWVNEDETTPKET